MITSSLEKWCAQLLDLTYEVRFKVTCIYLLANLGLPKDPTIQQRILGLVVEFAINPLQRNAPFVICVFQYVLDTKARLLLRPKAPNASQYNDAITEFQRYCSHQLQRIAVRTADFLMV